MRERISLGGCLKCQDIFKLESNGLHSTKKYFPKFFLTSFLRKFFRKLYITPHEHVLEPNDCADLCSLLDVNDSFL